MQAEDIIWGGNNKCEIKLLRDIGVVAGDVIDLVYNYMSDTYEAKKDSETSSIVVNQVNRRTLDNIYLSGNSPATIVRVIDADDQNLIVEVKVFQDTINFIKSFLIFRFFLAIGDNSTARRAENLSVNAIGKRLYAGNQRTRIIPLGIL